MFTRRIQHTDLKLYSGSKRIFPGMLALSGQMQAIEMRRQGRHSAGQILISEKKFIECICMLNFYNLNCHEL